MNFKPSQVISVVSVTGCPARVKDAAGSGKDGIYYFEAIPEQYVKAEESDAYDEIASSLPDDPKQRIKVRNNFTIPMVAGEKLEIVLDENGIGKMIVWPCEEDE